MGKNDDDDGDGDGESRSQPPANDPAVRSKITVMLGDAVEDPSPLFDLGRAIESVLFESHGGSDTNSGEYRGKARSIGFNLKRNASLRARVVAGEVTPEELCAMTPDELATDELKKKRARMEEKATRKRTRGAMVGLLRSSVPAWCVGVRAGGGERGFFFLFFSCLNIPLHTTRQYTNIEENMKAESLLKVKLSSAQPSLCSVR